MQEPEIHSSVIYDLFREHKIQIRGKTLRYRSVGHRSVVTEGRRNLRKERRNKQVWWFTHVIHALRRLRQTDHEFKARKGYRVTSTPTWKKSILLTPSQKNWH
jgi:hypothetical protein